MGEEFLEKYRWVIGTILLMLILASSGFLLWRENKWKPDLERRLALLETKLEQIKMSSAEEPLVSAIVEPDALTNGEESQTSKKEENLGKVAGVSANSNAEKSASHTSKTVSKPAMPSIININSAGKVELDSLTGIGEVKAQAIIDYRNSHGKFKTIEEIKNVKGIGDATFDKIKARIRV